jgi:hypothetical protein
MLLVTAEYFERLRNDDNKTEMEDTKTSTAET